MADTAPAPKAIERTGECRAVACSYGCRAFTFVVKQDGYRVCACGHTQHIHARPAGVADTMNHGDE